MQQDDAKGGAGARSDGAFEILIAAGGMDDLIPALDEARLNLQRARAQSDEPRVRSLERLIAALEKRAETVSGGGREPGARPSEQAFAVSSRQELDRLRKSCRACTWAAPCQQHRSLTFNPNCHPSAGSSVRYLVARGVVEVRCAACSRPMILLAIADALPEEFQNAPPAVPEDQRPGPTG